jgi:hypothetical protein
LKRAESRLDSAPVNFFKRIIYCGTALLFFTARWSFGQAPTAPSPSAAAQKLEVENIISIPLDQRRDLLSALNPEQREKFAEQFRNLPAGGPSNGKINALFMAWAQLDAAQAIESAKKFPTPDMRRAALEAICFGMKPADGKASAQSIRDFHEDVLPAADKERLLGMAIVKWSQDDQPAAAQFLAQVYPDAATRLAKPGAGDGDLLITTRALAENWGAANPQAALDWFQKKQHPANLVAIKRVIIGWWRKDAQAAAAYLTAHSSTPDEREVAAEMAGPMALRDPAVAVQWVEWMKEERMRRRMRLAIAEIWAARDPKAAGAWSVGLVGKEGEEAIAAVAGSWGSQNSAAAEKWINSLHGRARDRAIRGYATAMGRTNPSLALTWAMKVEEREARRRVAKAIAAQWMKRDADEFHGWLKKSKLSDAEKKQLLETSSNPN